MSYLLNATRLWIDQASRFETFLTTIRGAATGGTLTSDLLVKETAKLWVQGLDGMLGMFSFLNVEPVPVMIARIAAGGAHYTSPVGIGFSLPGATSLPSTLVGLNGGTLNFTSKTAIVRDDGVTMDVTLSGLSGQRVGDLYWWGIYHEPGSQVARLVAQVFVSIV